RITIGTRAASKVLVHVTAAAMLLLACAASAYAQAQPFEILDNSFLVEEAFNQEPGIFQNIFGIRADDGGGWEAAFTQEWPLFSQTHQISYTLPYAAVNGTSGVGDVAIHYRWQALTETASRPAFSPRLSLLVPTSDGSRDAGWQ